MMKVVLATGIYPPDIGGPATYVFHLAQEFVKKGISATVVTYGSVAGDASTFVVSPSGGPLLRWWRYANVLKRVAHDADIVYCFSSVSTGVPLLLSRLKRPARVLRLGGDFFWERATDCGATRTLQEWYEERTPTRWFRRRLMRHLLQTFSHIVFSTAFQEKLYEGVLAILPPHTVIENALRETQRDRAPRAAHRPFRLLFLGRTVAFKNLPSLLEAVSMLPMARLTIVGSGPQDRLLRKRAEALHVADRIAFLPPVAGMEKEQLFAEHDLLVLPSLTEISPHAALEARSYGLPVLLTQDTGLSESLSAGMVKRDLRTPAKIANAIKEVQQMYDGIANEARKPFAGRTWESVADEHMRLFYRIHPVS